MNIKDLSARAVFLLEHLDLPEATGDPDAKWEPFQIEYLNNSSLLAADTKTRQAGWSWISAADAVAGGALEKRSNYIFVSINQDEAAEKIRYARYVIEALDREVRPKLIIENRLELEFENGSRLTSHPCKPVRGKPKAHIRLDEFAHYPKDREIYRAALPATSRGGDIRMGSSPLGPSGLFWEIVTQTLRPYPGFKRSYIPWWHIGALCRNVPEAREVAPHMTTDERVRLYGSKRLIEIFENLPLDDFQQEYECAFLAEGNAWISWDEIKANQMDDQAGRLGCLTAKGKEAALELIDTLLRLVREGKVESALAGGLDVGRKKNASELFFLGKGTTSQLPLRAMITLEAVSFDDQLAVYRKALDLLPITKLLIDQNGIGMQLAEQLSLRYSGRAEGAIFTNPNKELWAVEYKVRMQRKELPIPLDRDLSYQIHSIKKKYTADKHAVFDTEGNEKHHADKFWAHALAVWAAKGEGATNWNDVNGLGQVNNYTSRWR